MKPFRIKTERAKTNEVDRAISGVRSAMIKLASRMCTDDPRDLLRVYQALREIGEFAGGPLAVAMSRTPDPGHRVLMLSLLREIGSFADSDVFNVLKRMAKNDPNERVAAMAEGVLMHLLDRQAAADLGGEGRGRGSPPGGRSSG